MSKKHEQIIKNTVKISVVLVVITISVFIGLIAYIMQTLCDDSVVYEIGSPTGDFKAVYFIRDCGATTAFVNNVSILPKNRKFTGSNRFVVMTATYADNVQIEWVNETKVLIKMDCKKVFKQKTNINGIEIFYQLHISDT